MAKHTTWYRKHFRWKRMRVNQRYKDRLFRFLFRDKRDLLELYNAVNGSDYTNPEDLEIITLEDVIFMKMKNDLSFMIYDQMNLYEHQSTFSPNMPLRGLLYFAQQYEGLLAQKKDSVYGSKLIRLPTPAYVIFYNGKKEQEDRMDLLLSDAFEGGRGSGCLECQAVMLNINRGHNRKLMEKCRRLWEYSEFIAEVNESLAHNLSLKAAVTNAMEECIRRGILTDILLKNRAEVFHMLLTEYDEKKHMKGIYQEGYEEGEQVGYTKGEQAGYSKGEQAGYAQGEYDLLVKQVQKKLQRGKSAVVIAEELEMKQDTIEKIIDHILHK